MREAAGLAAGGFAALRSTEVTTPLAASTVLDGWQCSAYGVGKRGQLLQPGGSRQLAAVARDQSFHVTRRMPHSGQCGSAGARRYQRLSIVHR